jgi:UDP-N-acetylglucosamine transferase subunit ALG13
MLVIFATVGTTDFDALVARMDQLAPGLEEEVVIQLGRGGYTPRHARHFRFLPALDEYYRCASMVVSHGGLGTLIEVLRLRKPLIGVNNPDRFDLHQTDLLGELERGEYLFWCRDLATLLDAIRRIPKMTFRPYDDPPCRIHEAIADFLGGRDMASWKGAA